MPRRKRAFIQRSSASTYHVVHQPLSDNPNHHVLVSDNKNEEGRFEEIEPNDANIANSYQKREFELGEYGFPDDGYDYLKHFKTIGGGGGVYINATTGLPDSDAISKSQVLRSASERPDNIALRTEADYTADIEVHDDDILDPHVSEMRKSALEEIERDRKRNSSLDEIIALLEGGDIAPTKDKSSPEKEVTLPFLDDDFEGSVQSHVDEQETEKDPEKYFSVLVSDKTGSEAVCQPATENEILKGVLEKYNEPRLLDAQFDNFMKSFESDSSSNSDLEELRRRAQSNSLEEDVDDDILALLNTNDQSGYEFGIDESGLLESFTELKMGGDEDDAPHASNKQVTMDSNTKDTEAQTSITEVERYREVEFEKGMTGLLDSYTRISASEALEMKDGSEGAKQALRRQEKEDIVRFERKHDIGIESDDNDSELDTLFEEQYGNKEEQWDCETIISTYTNTDNHPSVIDGSDGKKRRPVRKQTVVQLDPQTQLPTGILPEAVTSSTHSNIDFGSRRSDVVKGSVRNKEESKEEKKTRKAAVKEAARERRALKSEMKKAFTAENVKQGKHGTALGTSKVVVQF